jgi:hypothetical protein
LFAAALIIGTVIPGSLKAEIKTIRRIDDPVVMECKDFTPLFGNLIDRLALMARNGDEWAPIPFQIDQKKPDGGYAFTNGPEASVDPDPNLDANDELVFMVKDAGDRVNDVKWPDGAEKMVEVEINDPKNGNKGWMYLVSFSEKAPRSPVDYIKVEIDEAGDWRKVVTYEYVMGGPADRPYPDYMAARQLPPDGREGLDVLDRLKMRGEIVLPLGIRIPFAFDDMTKSEDKGWIDGPVRILHYAEGYLELTEYIKIRGGGYSLISYYTNHMIWPMALEMGGGSSAWDFIKIENFRGYLDFNQNVYGSYTFNAANSFNKDVVFDGKMSEAEKNLNTETYIDWIAGFGPQGALIHRLFTLPKSRAQNQVTYYFEDETASDPPEESPGVIAVGYEMKEIDSVLGSGESSVAYQYYYYLSELKPEEVYRILDILDHPVESKVRAIESPDIAPTTKD